ncbi:dabb-domain-containing protein [Hesseltinella vesiculosa]|uniref:Dabb-domain-containing protein n=1 Tax=Hesseltinella vesiculosa TaxID=101127 RepID=A0A1X2G5E5_9FUNG|nr:dabb-domain-containing protein [Hesseltinella vesiculosa]
MTLVHIVLVKFKPDVEESIRHEALKDVLALKDHIPSIVKASAGKNYTDRSKGYDWGWVVELESKEDLPAYASHEAHQDFLTKYKPLFEDVIAVDYEA